MSVASEHTCKELDVQELVRWYRNSATAVSGTESCRHLKVLLLDYDGTLSPIVEKPELAVPSKELLGHLSRLCSRQGTLVYIISGRDGPSLEGFVGDLAVGLSCEHGRFFRQVGSNKGEWQAVGGNLDLSWKEQLRPTMEAYTRQIPRSFIEEKRTNLTFHYRLACPHDDDQSPQSQRVRASVEGLANRLHSELVEAIRNPQRPGSDFSSQVEVREGKRTVEVRPCGINKGGVVQMILDSINSGTGLDDIQKSENRPKQTVIRRDVPPSLSECQDFQVDFVLCMGDDETDEDMFRALSPSKMPGVKHLVSCSVGQRPNTSATHYVHDQKQVLQVLAALAECAP